MKRAGGFLVLVVLLVTLAAPAHAASPVVAADLDVQLWPAPEPGQLLVIVGVKLPDGQDLPATVRLPIIGDMDVAWAGEVSTSTAGDRQVTPKIRTTKDGRFAEFEMTQSRTAQIELTGILGTSGQKVETGITWVQTAAAPTTGFAVRVPPGASDVRIMPAPVGTPEKNPQGETLYTLPSRELKVGQEHRIDVTYITGAGEISAGGSAGVTPVLIGLAVALLLAVAVLFAVVRRQGLGGGPSVEE